MARRILALLVLAGLTHVVLANAVIKSVRDLKRVLLEPAPGAEGCVRLLHRAGSIGCFTPQDLPVTAPMFELADAHLTGHEAHPGERGRTGGQAETKGRL
ncbi:hypothetical protein H632_c354p1 [Helicosporidium sp. ATCC 50920]|nr:hypothetical protein H632_c354p1 [Helicosporidium sp. ATCC 50920]|eukprot:KDD76104.1 hypothetical protein H632_c354p1 [Helicosporidium sp. ATCC 50920]